MAGEIQIEAFSVRPLPPQAATLLQHLHAPPRLVAHLQLVHDVATHLVVGLQQTYPTLPLQSTMVLFGAATHDIGKIVYPEELSQPGHLHEAAGERLLLQHGISPHLARFARTHAAWHHPDTTCEDLLVALADTCWKGTRDTHLEHRVVACMAVACGQDYWDVFLSLDELVEQLAGEADRRLIWQAQFPVLPVA